MNVLTLLAMTFAIAFVAPVARYAYQKLVDCSATAAVMRVEVAASAEKDFDPRV